jgi:hypothetical protein
MIVTMFTEPADQAKAIAVYSFVAASGGAIGLLLGGVLTEMINWHWIFFVNIPIGIATGVAALKLLKHEEGIGFEQSADVPGALVSVGSLMLLVYTIVETSTYGWGSLHTVGFGALSVALLVGFFVREATAKHPLMPLRIFQSRNISVANGVQALMVAGIFGMFFLGALYLQQVLGYDAVDVGLAFLPIALAIAALSLGVSARLITRFGAKNTLIPGLAVIPIGLAYFARAPIDADYLTDLFPAFLLLGIGAGLSFPSLMTLAIGTRIGTCEHDPAGRRRTRPRGVGDDRHVTHGNTDGRRKQRCCGAAGWIPCGVGDRRRALGGRVCPRGHAAKTRPRRCGRSRRARRAAASLEWTGSSSAGCGTS